MKRAVGRGFGRGHIARDVDEELAFHMDMRADQLMREGLTPDDAHRAAAAKFGDPRVIRESCITFDQDRERAMNRANILADLRQDIVYAARTLRVNAGLTAVVALTLALGIGANTAIFTLVNAVILRKLNVRAPDELVVIGDPGRPTGISFSSEPRTDLLSYPTYSQLRSDSTYFSGLLAVGRTDRLDLVSDASGEPTHPRGRFVSGNYFQVLGVPAYRGRAFDGSEDSSVGGAPVVVISYGYWMQHFAGDERIVNREVLLNGARFTIIGVGPPGFTGEVVGRSTDIWLPITMQPTVYGNRSLLKDPQTYWLLFLGRRRPGVTLAQIQAALEPRLRQIFVQQPNVGAPQEIEKVKVTIVSGARGLSSVREAYGGPLVALLVGVGVLLLIICANVANLLLARAVARGREMSVRLAIGAGRGRLLRQLITEGALLGVLGATIGLVLARWGSKLLLTLVADGGATLPLDVALDTRVLAFTAGVAMLAVALFALAPALRATRVDLISVMRASASSLAGGGLGTRGQRVPIGKLLIAVQVALSVVLLVGAAMLVRSLFGVQRADAGLDRDHLLVVDLDVYSRNITGDRLVRLGRDLAERVGRVPGAAAVTYSENGLFSGSESANNVGVPGFVARERNDSIARYDEVGPAYVKTIGAHLVSGRDFTPEDDPGSAKVILVNEAFARFYFGTVDPVGRSIRVGDSAQARIVGVVADVKDHRLTGAPTPRYYTAYQQQPFGDPGMLRILVRSAGDPASITNAVRATILGLDRDLPISDIEPLSRLMRDSVREERLLTRLAAGFGIMALLLAAVGLYGVMSYAITRRTGEIGLRVALGADRGRVIGMVLGDAMRLVVAGIVVGIPLALVAARGLRHQLHGISTADPWSLVIALSVLLGCGVFAAFLPALRASRVAPVLALREE